MKNQDTSFKTKLIVSFVLLFLIVSFLTRKPSADENNIETRINNITTVKENNINVQEQKKYLDYLSCAKINMYECETNFRNIETGSVIEDDTEYGKGAKVVHCSSGNDKPGYIVKGAITSSVLEKINGKFFNDTLHSFYIKPRLRIKKELINPMIENYNDRNLFTPVCRLEIVNTEGKVIKTIEYEALNFLEKHPADECRIYYSGNYHEGFGGYLSFDSLIIIDGKEINPKGKLSIEKTKLDYRIYWYGYTDIWLDYIEVKNDAARELLNGGYDMWLKAMDSLNVKDIEKINTTTYPQICYDYILKNIMNRNLVSN